MTADIPSSSEVKATFDVGAINLVRDTAPDVGKTVVLESYGNCFGENFERQIGSGEGAQEIESGFRRALEKSIAEKGPLAEGEARLLTHEGRKIIAVNTFGVDEALIRENKQAFQAVQKATANALRLAESEGISELTFSAMRGYQQTLGFEKTGKAMASGFAEAGQSVAKHVVCFHGDTAGSHQALIRGLANSGARLEHVGGQSSEITGALNAAGSSKPAAIIKDARAPGGTPRPQVAAETAEVVEKGLLGMIKKNRGRSALAAAAALGVGWAAYEALRTKEPTEGQTR